MARNVYVTALEPGTGKSAVILGLTEMLSRRAGRLGFFRPLIASAAERDADLELMLDRFRLPQEYERSYALTLDDLHDVTDRTGYTRLLERVLTAYRTLADGDACPRAPMIGEGVTATAVADAAATAAAEVIAPDVVVVEGSDFTGGSLAVELDFNVDAANHLGAPVLLVVRGRRRTAEQVLDSVASGLTTLRDHGCTLIGVVANRVDPAVDRRGAGRAARRSSAATSSPPPCRRRRSWPRRPSPRSRGRWAHSTCSPRATPGRWTAGSTARWAG